MQILNFLCTLGIVSNGIIVGYHLAKNDYTPYINIVALVLCVVAVIFSFHVYYTQVKREYK